jgi:hypothetical protein
MEIFVICMGIILEMPVLVPVDPFWKH